VGGSSPGWVQGIINNIQVSGIANYTTGAPISITGISTIAGGSSNPVVVGSNFDQSLGGGKISETANGVPYCDGWTTIPDPNPQISSLDGLTSGFSNRVLQDPSGNIVLVNAQPGQAGNLGAMTVRGPGRFDFDANIVKRIRIDESKTVEMRVDVVNVMKH